MFLLLLLFLSSLQAESLFLGFLSSSSSSFSAESLVVRVADTEAKAALPPVMSTCATFHVAGTVSPGSRTRVKASLDAEADGFVLSPEEIVSARTESEKDASYWSPWTSQEV